MKPKNKEIFLKHEGDEWFRRNVKNIESYNKKNDKVFLEVKKIIKKHKFKPTILEVGSSTGARLKEIKKEFKLKNIYGVDPSKKAVKIASKYINAKVSTADSMHKKFKRKKFDIIIFGFCLYLCDPSDYKQIFKNTINLLQDNGYLIILDFYTKFNYSVKYKHDKKITVYKRNYKKLFNKKFFDLRNLKIFELKNDKKKSKYAVYIFQTKNK